MKIVILYSGGLDSYLMKKWAEVKHPEAEVKCVFYAHGQDAEESEIRSLPDFVTVRKIDWLGDDIKPIAKKDDPFAGAIYIPGRNLIFSALAASQEIADEIWMGTVWDEDNPKGTDKNEKFRHDTSDLLTYVLSPFIDNVSVKFPFVEAEMTKEKMVKWALENGVTEEELTATVSCWHQKGDKPCGECKQCSKRMLSFGLNGFEDDFEIHPTQSSEQQQNMLEYLKIAADTDVVDNRDEANMIDMMVRYFTPKFENSTSLNEWEQQMWDLIKTIK